MGLPWLDDACGSEMFCSSWRAPELEKQARSLRQRGKARRGPSGNGPSRAWVAVALCSPPSMIGYICHRMKHPPPFAPPEEGGGGGIAAKGRREQSLNIGQSSRGREKDHEMKQDVPNMIVTRKATAFTRGGIPPLAGPFCRSITLQVILNQDHHK